MSTLGAAVTSVSAMVTGVITGGATLLTSWVYWVLASDITNYYIGYIWFGAWITLFLYAGYKIATSDNKKWMNLVGRGSNYLGVAILLFLVAQPIVVSYGASYLADTTSYTEIDYNVTDRFTEAPSTTGSLTASGHNTTSWYYDAATMTYDNDTKECITASITLPTVTDADQYRLYTYINSTFLADYSISKIVVSWTYVGTGNITSSALQIVTPSPTKSMYATTEDIDEIGTYTYTPAAFESNQIEASTQFGVWFYFADDSNLPTTGDYLSFSVKFYTTATVFSQAFMMLILASVMSVIDAIGILYATGLGPKYIW